MLKFALKKAPLNFMSGWITPEQLMQEEEAEEDLLTMVFVDDCEDAMVKIIQQLLEEGSEVEE